MCLKEYWPEQYLCKLKIMRAFPCVLCLLTGSGKLGAFLINFLAQLTDFLSNIL